MKLFTKTLLFFSIIIFITIFYKSEIYWKGNKFDYYLKYYLISVFLIFFFSLINFLPNKLRTYVLITFTTSLFSFYLFELYIITRSSDLEKENVILIKKNLYKKKFNKIYDERSLEQVYFDEVKEKTDTVLPVYPSSYLFNNYLEKKGVDFFPLSGISLKKTIVCNEGGFYSNYISDRYGFNNPNYEWDKKNIEYVLLGDSFVHGSCVNNPDDVGSVLRNITKKNVLNLGYGGNGPLIQLATLKEYSKNININNVLWFFHESNDMLNLKQELTNKNLIKYLENISHINELEKKQKKIDEIAYFNLEESYKKYENKSNEKNSFQKKLIDFIKLSSSRRTIFNYREPNNINKLDQILKEARRYSSLIGANFYVIYLPGFERYSKFPNKYSKIKKNLESIIKKQNINYIDIHSELFNKVENPLIFFPFELNGHYNENGYFEMGKIINNRTNN